MAKIVLAPGRDKSVKRHHPWIFSRAVAKVEGEVNPGSVVEVTAADGSFLAYGHYSPQSQIRVRLLSFDPKVKPNRDLLEQRITSAIALRHALKERGNDGLRLIDAEGDLLPGLIVDQYNDFIVISISSAGMEAMRDDIIAILKAHFPKASIYERSDVKSRLKEGLKERCGLICGKEPDDLIYVREENEVFLPIDIKHGHKTGGYLDQRANRKLCGSLAHGKKVLNCFAYTGGFGLWALKGGAAQVSHVDVSGPALNAAKAGTAFNHLDPGHCRFIKADVFKFLREQAEAHAQYDLVILDPPKFADNAAALKHACRGYQDINRLGLQLTAPGGTLLSFSCSGLMQPDLLQKIIADAALDAGRGGRIVRMLRQDEDHPIALNCPESFYLKGFEIKVD